MKIILGGGCFWCTEAVFQKMGLDVKSGYMAGENCDEKTVPSYENVSAGNGYIEVVQINYNPKNTNLSQILEVFFAIHDPTSKNAQGADIGVQYGSYIFYEDEKQKNIILKAIRKAQENFEKPIITKIFLAKKFFEAEDYHQDYYNSNPQNPYCSFVIMPKIKKTQEILKMDILKNVI